VWNLVFDIEGRGCLRRIFGPKRDEVTGEWRKLHNEELNDLHCSRRMRWAENVGRMWEWKRVYGFWRGNLRERDHWGDPGVNGRIILRQIFINWDVGYGLD
jgi:hypothetical protein